MMMKKSRKIIKKELQVKLINIITPCNCTLHTKNSLISHKRKKSLVDVKKNNNKRFFNKIINSTFKTYRL